MKKRSALLLLVTLTLPFQAIGEEGWSFSAGAGLIYTPTYYGDDESQLSAMPNFRVSYGERFYASLGEGIGYNLVNHKGFTAGPVMKYNFGRSEDGSNPFALTGEDSDDLRGLGDVDGAVELGVSLGYDHAPLRIKVEARHAVGGHEGFVGDASVHYADRTNIYGQSVIFAIGPELSYTDSNFNKAYFGVNRAQSAASGLAEYDADEATVSYGIGGNIMIPHNAHIATMAFARYSRLGATIADSSLILERGSEHQASFGVLVNYSF